MILNCIYNLTSPDNDGEPSRVSTSGIPSNGSGWPTVVSPGAIFLVFGYSAFVGIFFGFSPADKASLLSQMRHGMGNFPLINKSDLCYDSWYKAAKPDHAVHSSDALVIARRRQRKLRVPGEGRKVYIPFIQVLLRVPSGQILSIR
jgi:hypothetical protein